MKVCILVAPSVRISRWFSPDISLKPESTVIIVTIVEMRSAITMIASIPAPTQTMRIGPSAIFGRALSTTIYGSKILARVLLHHMSTAMSVPRSVPIIKPATVSNVVTPMCIKSSPLPYSLEMVDAMRLGLEKIKVLIISSRPNISHTAIKPMRIASCMNEMKRFFLFSLRRYSLCSAEQVPLVELFIFHHLLPHQIEIVFESGIVAARERRILLKPYFHIAPNRCRA